jgi:3-(3-hydroxy-phenyl)propionate hydroxylase
LTDDHEVIVVGLGPVGATLALLLARAGVSTLGIDRAAAPSSTPRAIALDDSALRVLQAAGLVENQLPELLTDVPVQALSMRRRPLLEIPPRHTELGQPALAFFHQPDLEHALRAAIDRQRNLEIRAEHDVEHVRFEARPAVVTARDLKDGSVRRFRAGWVAGCDGGSSTIRRQAGIPMRGFTGRPWLVVDATLRTAPIAESFAFVGDPARPTVSAPLPGKRHRWEFMLLDGEDPATMTSEPMVEALVAPYADPAELEIVRAGVYVFHSRVAERWISQKTLLAGDAAHLSPPFAGQGLSVGLRDAHNLAWKLAAVLRGNASPSLLRSYETERRAEAVRLIGLAVLFGALIQVRNPTLAALRDASLRATLAAPGVHPRISRGGWKPRLRYSQRLLLATHAPFVATRSWSPVVGASFPQPHVRLPDGARRRLDDVLGDDFALIAWQVDPLDALGDESRALLKRVPARVIRAATETTPGVRWGEPLVIGDEDGLLQRWFAAASHQMALIRPDRRVYDVFDAHNAPTALARLARGLRGDQTHHA